MVSIFFSCDNDSDSFSIEEILALMANNYDQMPEAVIAESDDGSVFAQYTNPTEKYQHGVLGDQLEAAQLVVNIEGSFYTKTLEEDYVFEDISPRLYDVDRDGEIEFICIRTHLEKGAGIVIYKEINGSLELMSYVKEIGQSNKWLNPVAIQNLDDDINIEIAWVQTPHIGGVLKLAEFTNASEPYRMFVQDSIQFFKNHAIGETNLCMSLVTMNQSGKSIFIPNQSGEAVSEIAMIQGKFEVIDEFTLDVDYSKPLEEQLSLITVVEQQTDPACINPG